MRSFCPGGRDNRPPITSLGSAVEHIQQVQSTVVPAPGPSGLEPDHLGERTVAGVKGSVGQRGQFAAEQIQVAPGQVNASVPEILPDVAQDVRQL